MSQPGRFEPGLRRVAELDPSAPLPPSEPQLVARISGEIRSAGPMTFARFMELALYEPQLGYYTRGDGDSVGPGRAGGDFLTAPESHPIFGWALSRHLESLWDALGRPARFVVREHGAGRGALAAAVLDGLRRSGSELVRALRYQAIDVSPVRRDALRATLDAAGLADFLEEPTDGPEAGAILANELLDALPVHRVQGGSDGQLLERFVDLSPGGGFREVPAAPSTLQLGAHLEAAGVELHPGQVVEVSLAAAAWVERVAEDLERGELLLIDYGHEAADLYDPDRGSTLRAYYRHRVHADPFVAIGRQDLTAHVDLTAVRRAAANAGLDPLGATTQARFLEGLGVGELLVNLQSDPATTLGSYLEAKSALVRMLDPRATGGFAVLGFGRRMPPGEPLRGFGSAR